MLQVGVDATTLVCLGFFYVRAWCLWGRCVVGRSRGEGAYLSWRWRHAHGGCRVWGFQLTAQGSMKAG